MSRLALRSLAVIAISLALAPLAHAQATRTWVSGVGDDVNPCSRTAPCKTFAGAISKTAAGGEISVLDPGGFGAVTITKSITIDGGGGAGFASILASGVQGIIINGPSGTEQVVLRNLSINGAGTTLGINGISILNAGRVYIENVQVSNFSNRGINDSRGGGLAKKLLIKDTIVRNSNIGIAVTPATAIVTGTLDNVQVVGNSGVGLTIDGGHIKVSNSNVSGNGSNGITVSNASGLFDFVMLDTVGMHVNGAAGVSVTGGTVSLSNCVITDNSSTGVAGNAVSSFQNNKIFGNGGGGDVLPVGSAANNQTVK